EAFHGRDEAPRVGRRTTSGPGGQAQGRRGSGSAHEVTPGRSMGARLGPSVEPADPLPVCACGRRPAIGAGKGWGQEVRSAAPRVKWSRESPVAEGDSA